MSVDGAPGRIPADDDAERFIGRRIPRHEDARLLTGRGRFVDDVVLPRMLHAAFVRSPVARGLITRLDVTAARAHPGVSGVLTLADLSPGDDGSDTAWAAGSMWPPLVARAVQFVGDPVAIVVACDRATAEDAVDLVGLEIDELVPLLRLEDAIRDESRFIGDDVEQRILTPVATPTQRNDQTFAGASQVISEQIIQHRYLPVPMETRGVVADWDVVAGELTVNISTQGSHRVRDHMALALGVSTNRVRVLVGDVGGAFGLKLTVGREETATALAARRLGRPVKWIEDRRENLIAGSHARAEQTSVDIALDDGGRLMAIDVEHVVDVGAYGPPNLGLARLVAGPYRVGEVSGTTTSVRTNTSSRGAYRGPWMFETVVRETMLDIAARRVGIDPLEMRRRNVIVKDDLPFDTPMGKYENVTPSETLEQAAEALGYDKFRVDQEEARRSGHFLGVGIALYMEHTAQPISTGVSDAVTLRIDPTGAVQLITGVNSQGHSVETTMSQVVAERLGVGLDDVRFVNGDTLMVPYGASTGGSRNAVYGGGSAIVAAEALRARLVAIGAHLLEAAPEDIEVGGSRVGVRGTPARSLSLADVARIAYLTPAELPPGIEPGLEIASRFTGGTGYTWSNAAHMCTCEVNLHTGEVSLLRYVVSEDCGTMINPMVVEGQIAGGVAQGIGGAMLEEFVYDDSGNPLCTTFMDYLLPTACDIPRLEYVHLETPSRQPGGFKGMAEGGAIGAPAAVINAVADALSPFGIEFTRQPLSPDAIVRALEAVGR